MELRIVVRRARKIVLITLFLLLILLSVLLFVIQSILDGVGLQYTIESYASVGTVYRSDAENAAFTPVEEDVLTLLAESDAIQKIDIRQTLSAKVHGMENVPCYFRFLYKGIIIKHNKTEPTYTKTSLFLCEKRRFFMARTEKGGNIFKLAGPRGLAFFHLIKKEVSKWPMKK